MTIVLLVRSLNYGGAERQVVELAKALHGAGHSVAVAVFYREGALLEEIRQAGVPVFVLNKRARWDVVGFLWRLGTLLRRLQPHVVYAFLVEPRILAVLLKPIVPRTRVVWAVRASAMDFAWYGWFPRFAFRLSRWLARFADLTIANSWTGADYHRSQGYPAARMVVVPNGFDLTWFRPDAEAGRRLRLSWGIADEERVIGVVGRLDPIKDHGTFLKAAALLRLERPDLRFVCVGEGTAAYADELRAQAESLGISDVVLWPGSYQDMRAIYNAFDVLCLTSLSEGFPNVLGEAMACGVPCVATDVGDAARILDTCGVLVPPQDPQRLAEGIRRVLAEAGPERKRACRERIEREFSLGRMVQHTERLFRACVDASA